MPPLTRLARLRARARRCARSAPEKRPNREKWTSKAIHRVRIALEWLWSGVDITQLTNTIHRLSFFLCTCNSKGLVPC